MSRTPLVLVAGLQPAHTARVAADLRRAAPGTVVVHHDVRGLAEGVVIRTVRADDGTEQTALELAHGCLSCTLRLDVLPLLRELAARPGTARIVLELDPALEPEQLCVALDAVELEDGGTAGDAVRVEAVVAVLEAATWLDDVTGEESLAELGLAATPDDERTVAQVLLGATGFADVLVLAGPPVEDWTAARLHAALERWAPLARVGSLEHWRPARVLTALPRTARRGRVRHPHDALLAGQPPLDADAGLELVRFSARRPFHPERLHEAFDVLLDGVVGTRGRLWLATQHDAAVWLESAGGGLQLGDAGQWLATLGDDPQLWAQVDDERRVAAALRWDPVHGDRDTELVVLTHRQPAGAITAALAAALLTDDELAAGPDGWSALADPFGAAHTDPCEASSPADPTTHAIEEQR
ncbi:ribosome hibernation factor-recruiting GTPase MRF [Klenkia taihuensis]|uniref:GTPase, G3E family n=1 Tax=Klenkia taihuensis TaxID=1225127 RepID=A0A1I1QLL7_9ACTN|nr:GTP-binding protein [Klenkia taihuensis]GHE07700.1 putative cobalamin synthesis protein [Klenkia taihuensis]SFD23031.1 GTPase, G3E family [Klenkia taihuensis]